MASQDAFGLIIRVLNSEATLFLCTWIYSFLGKFHKAILCNKQLFRMGEALGGSGEWSEVEFPCKYDHRADCAKAVKLWPKFWT